MNVINIVPPLTSSLGSKLYSTIAIVGTGEIPSLLAEAIRVRGLANEVTDDPSEAELVILAELGKDPCSSFELSLRDIPREALVTDLQPLKLPIMRRLEARSSRIRYAGSHLLFPSRLPDQPEASFEEATAFITVSPELGCDCAARVGLLWEMLGARTVYLHAQRHDQLVSFLEYLPRMVEPALHEVFERSGEDANLVRLLTGGGLAMQHPRSLSDEEDLLEFCGEEYKELARQLRKAGQVLSEFADLVENRQIDRLRQLLRKHRRDFHDAE